MATFEDKGKRFGKTLTALIVDDDRMVGKIHRKLLGELGFITELVDNGLKAVELYRAGETFDIVFMDYEMPVMDGAQATKELRDMDVKSVIVGVTSRGREAERQTFMQAGLNACTGKPLDRDFVMSLLQKLEKDE